MKKIILLILLLKSGIGLSQNEVPFFEQIAFDFYRTEILTKHPVNKKIKIWKEIKIATDDPYWFPRCLDNFKSNGIDSLNQKISNKKELNLSNLDKNKFRIKSNRKGNNPLLFINNPFTIKGMNIVVNVTELHKDFVNIYHIEMDTKGNVLNWCKGGYVY